MTIAELFPDEDYRFHLRFERSTPEAFFAPSDRYADVIAERQHWLHTQPTHYAALLPAGEPLLLETTQFARSWSNFLPPADTRPHAMLVALGCTWEPDFLLLKLDSNGRLILHGGAVCFPSSWRLRDKLGKDIEDIHGPVPGLNQQIGPVINKFLVGLKPGAAFLRHNWGLARTPERNQHPDRNLARLAPGLPPTEVWLRMEHQALIKLPASDGLLFAIRISHATLTEIQAQPMAAMGLARALRTMPDELAEYKGLADCRTELIQMLDRRPAPHIGP